jgi:uncharacterized protein
VRGGCGTRSILRIYFYDDTPHPKPSPHKNGARGFFEVDRIMTLANLSRSDIPWVLALSAQNEVETGFLDEAKLAGMIAESFRAVVATPDFGYLITFAPDADYNSPNLKWFVNRATRFIYVDRIVVAAHARGQGIARAFYEDLFVAARQAGYDEVTCEVNSDPPNPVSDKFHAALGFLPVGSATLPNGKTVTYMARPLKDT